MEDMCDILKTICQPLQHMCTVFNLYDLSICLVGTCYNEPDEHDEHNNIRYNRRKINDNKNREMISICINDDSYNEKKRQMICENKTMIFLRNRIKKDRYK